MVEGSGLENLAGNSRESGENAQIGHICGAPDAMFAEGSDDCDGPYVGTDLSRQAFFGKAAFLRSCAAVLDFTNNTPIIHGKRRSTLFTYYIGARTGPIKIGSARDVYARLMILQTGNPEQLYIYATEPGGLPVERMRHSQFAGCRLFGEWFSRTDELLRHIISLQATKEPTE